MNVIKSIFGVVITIFFTTGCSSIGNVLISPHPDSLRSGSQNIFLSTEEQNICLPPEPSSGNGLSSIVGVATSIAITGVVKLLKEEGKQYKASYSAVKSGDFALVLPPKDPISCIKFVRLDKKKNNLFNFNTYFNRQITSVRLDIDKPHISGFKAKVASWPPITLYHGRNPWAGDSWSSKVGNTFGWVNPFMVLHAIYGIFDKDIYSMDTKVEIKIDTVARMGNQTKLINVGNIVLNTGKHSVLNLHVKKKNKPPHFTTGYMALPLGIELPTNITITAVESNDFGNIVGKGAKQIGDNKDSITDTLFGWL